MPKKPNRLAQSELKLPHDYKDPMPEIHFQVELPDGLQSTCYSPSLVLQDYFEAGKEYSLTDFVERSRTSLQIASNRVYAKYGMPCSRAQAQLQQEV